MAAMTDAEIKQTLIAICEAIKAQMDFASDINRSVVALANTLFGSNPDLRKLYDEQWTQLASLLTVRSLGPNMSEQIEKIDTLIQKMKA